MPHRTHAFGATDALLLLMATIWGINYTAVKSAGHAFGPLSFTWMRVLLATITLFVVAFAQRKAWPSRRDVLWLLALGVLGNGIYQLFFVFGVARTRVGNAALIVASVPAFIAIIGRVRGVDRISRRGMAGIALSIAGVGVVMYGSTTAAATPGSALGILLMLCAVACWCVFTVALQPFSMRVDTVQINALTVAGGMIPLLFATPLVLATTPFAAAPASAWLWLMYSAVVSMGLAYLFWYRGLRVLGPTRTSVYGNLQPLIAILVGWALLSEVPTLWQIVGALTIITGIFLTRA